MIKKIFYKTKERLYKRLFILEDRMKILLKVIAKICDIILLLGGMLFSALLIVRLGFEESSLLPTNLSFISLRLFLIVFLAKYIQEVIRFPAKKRTGHIFELIFFVFNAIVLWANLPMNSEREIATTFFSSQKIVVASLVIIFTSEGYKLFRILHSIKLAPGLLFALSFLLLIFIGSGLLMLPNSKLQPISYLEALFTAASAVCVTGLVVVDTAVAFTQTGQLIILSLIQIGGLGIMAFTGFFAYAFTGTFSYKDRLLLKDMFSADTLSDIFRMLLKIILLTFFVEAIGAVTIYFNVREIVEKPIEFSIFHSISAFCNAGFSTIDKGLASQLLFGNSTFYLTIAVLVILGGIGFPVMVLFYSTIKFRILNFRFLQQRQKSLFQPVRYTIGNKLVIYTTVVLLLAGTIGYFLLEKEGSLASNESFWQKLVISLFGSVSARTAGFNMIDMTQWCHATVFMMIVLMWIGASPGSTGGGIKTTTVAIAVIAGYNFIRGRHHLDISYRQIGNETIMRVLVVIVLSIVVVIAGFFALLVTEPTKEPVSLLFETVSAFATVGLSIADTSSLSQSGKVVVILLMYIGRVGPLTLLSGIFVSHRKRYYRYPEYDLTIN